MVTPKRPWLFDELRSRYENPLEVAAYTDQITDGLLAEEQAVIQHVQSRPCRTLVLGCGAGREVFALTEQGYEVTGADISRGMIRAAQRAEKRRQQANDTPTPHQAKWVWMEDPLRLPMNDSSYTLVIAFAQLISHIPNEESRIALLKEVRRVLEPGGKLIASFTDRHEAVEFFRPDSHRSGSYSNSAVTTEADAGRNHDTGDETFADLERAAGWEDGDLLIWKPSEADLDEPLFFHLHTRTEITREIEEAGLQLHEILKPRDLTPQAAPDGHLYPFVVAGRTQ